MNIADKVKQLFYRLAAGEKVEPEEVRRLTAEASNVRGTADLDTVAFYKTVTDNIGDGFEDQTTSLKPLRARSVTNRTRNKKWDKRLLAKEIHKSIDYTLEKSDKREDWDHTQAADLTDGNVLRSIRPDVVQMMEGIQNKSGKKLSKHDIASVFRNRIIETDLSSLSRDFFVQLSKKTKGIGLDITLDENATREVKEAAAISLMDNHKIPLGGDHLEGSFSHIAPMWKTMYEDLAVRLIVDSDSGIDDTLFPTDDETLTFELSSGDLSSVPIYDGDYIKVDIEGVETPIKLNSERDHAYIVPDYIKNKALELLGGDPSWKLAAYVNYLEGNNIEFTYDTEKVNGIRPQDFYVYKIQRDTVETTISDASPLIKETKAKYTRTVGDENINDLVKYKANIRFLFIEYDDLILDYALETGGSRGFYLTQQDIVFDNELTRKDYNVYTRQLPWVLVIVPTDKPEYNPKKLRSSITLQDDNRIHRELKFEQSYDPDLSDSLKQVFLKIKMDSDQGGTGVFGNSDTQARYFELDTSGKLSETYRGDKPTTRRKTTTRKIKEIIEELTTNYILDNAWSKPQVLDFDVFSRLTFKEFSEYLNIDSPEIVDRMMRRGDFGARVVPSTRGDVKRTTNQTRLRYRDPDAPDDEYPVLKSMTTKEFVPNPRTPPTMDELYSGGLVKPGGGGFPKL